MKEPPASKGSPKIRLRFKAKDLERMDLEEMRRFLEAARLPEIEAEPESVEEEPVGVVPRKIHEEVVPSELPDVVGYDPKPKLEESFKWSRLKWVSIGFGVLVMLSFLFGGTYILVDKIRTGMAKKDWPDVPNTQLNLEWQARAEAGDSEAQYLLASHLAGELDEDPKPAPKVFELFDQAAKKEHPRATSAMRNLAWCYEYGVGTEEDAAQAEKWKKRANDAGLPVMDDTVSVSRVSRALVSGLVLLGWLGFLSAARGIWRRRLKKLSDAEREQMTAMVYFDVGTYARTFVERFGTLLLLAFFVGLTWAMYRAEVPATTAFFLAMVIGLPASALLLFIVGELRWDPFPEFDYHRGGTSDLQRSDTRQFHLIIRKLPLLFVLSLLFAQFIGLGWGVLVAISLVGLMHHREVDVLPQLDIWPGPDCRVSDPQSINWFIRRLPLHIIYLLVFLTMGWVVLLISILFLEPAYIFSKSAIRQQFVIIQEKEPPRLAENTADMITRRMRYAPTMLSFWWAIWVSLIICGALMHSVHDFSVEISLGLLSLPGFAWFGMWAMLKQMRDRDGIFRSFPWIVFICWIIGLCTAAASAMDGSMSPFYAFVCFFGVFLGFGIWLGDLDLLDWMKGNSKKENFLKRQLFLSTSSESPLMGSWRIKSRQLLFTAGCIGMLLALGSNMVSGDTLRQMSIGTFGVGLIVVFAVGLLLLEFNAKLLPEKQLVDSRIAEETAPPRYFWGALAENFSFIFVGAMVMAWLVMPSGDVGGFDYFWARVLFLGLPVMCIWICLCVRFPALQSYLLLFVMIGFGAQVLGSFPYSIEEPKIGLLGWMCSCFPLMAFILMALFFAESLIYGLKRLYAGISHVISAIFESLQHVPDSETVPKPWFHITTKGLQARWGMLLSTGILMAVLFVSAGIWIYGGEKNTPTDIIKLTGNSYKVLGSGFLLPIEPSP